MGIIQNSINQGAAAVGSALALNKRLEQEQLKSQAEGLKDYVKLADSAAELYAKDKEDAAEIQVEQYNIDQTKNLSDRDIRNSYGQFVTGKEAEEFKNGLIAESEVAMKRAQERIDARRYQINQLQARLELSDKMMGKDTLNKLKGMDLNSNKDLIHDIKQGKYDPFKEYGGNK